MNNHQVNLGSDSVTPESHSSELTSALKEACGIIEECGEELGAGPMSGIADALNRFRALIAKQGA